MRAFALTIALAFLVLGGCVTPIMAQGVTAGYTVYVSFFYPLCFLYNLHVTILDQTGRVIGTGMSADGGMVTIPIRTESAVTSLTASASGSASGPLTNYIANPSFWFVSGRSTVPVEVTGGDYWMTIVLSH